MMMRTAVTVFMVMIGMAIMIVVVMTGSIGVIGMAILSYAMMSVLIITTFTATMMVGFDGCRGDCG